MQEQEIWKAIVNYEGLYEVSNLGRVRNSRTGKILKPYENGRGYLIIGLYKDSKKECFQVHRLTATAFIPNPQNLETVNHINHSKIDNRVENLEWLSLEDNIRDEQKGKPKTEKHRKKIGEANKGKTLSEEHKQKLRVANNKKVLCVETGQVFNSIREACDWLGIKQNCTGNISLCCKGKRGKAYGYSWRYVEESD